MSNHQRARRFVFWRSSFFALATCTALMLFGALAGRYT